MPTDADPIQFNWYSHTDKGQRFRVVAFDEEDGLVELQYFDGQVEEIDINTWYQMEVEPCEAPENWSGAMDIGEKDDLGTEITDTENSDWIEPLQELKKPTEPTDDWGEGFPEEEPLDTEP